MESNTSDRDDLTTHDDLQKGEKNDVPDEHAEVGGFWPKCLTRIKRLIILVAVLLILAIGFIVLIIVSVSTEQTETKGCNENTCKNGTCTELTDGYKCICSQGYTGYECQEEIIECNSQPCMHGTCVDYLGSYTCECVAGFNGSQCEVDIDDCFSNPCIHGICLDGVNRYNCSCFNGYNGTICQEEIDECSSNPCMNGICRDGIAEYTCECFAGYNGTNCEKEGTSYNDFWIGPISIESKTWYVNFTLVHGQDTYSNLRACAEASTDNRFLATRIHKSTGECDALTWDWGSDPQYEDGFSYLRKTKTIESYLQPLQISKHFQWLFPGTFGVGSILDFYISIPPGQRWKAFEFSVMDTTEYSFHVYDSEPEIILIYAQIENRRGFASVHFKIYRAGWDNKLFLGKTALADGKPHRFTFVPLTNKMKILLDDTEVVEYPHVTDPATAKQINFIPYSIPEIQIHNITFSGV